MGLPKFEGSPTNPSGNILSLAHTSIRRDTFPWKIRYTLGAVVSVTGAWSRLQTYTKCHQVYGAKLLLPDVVIPCVWLSMGLQLHGPCWRLGATLPFGVGMVQSVQWLGWELDTRFDYSHRQEFFCSLPYPDLLWGPHGLLCSGCRGSFPVGKAAGALSW
jgi:hypothetical protein